MSATITLPAPLFGNVLIRNAMPRNKTEARRRLDMSAGAKSADGDIKKRKHPKWSQKTRANREVKKAQKSTSQLIMGAPLRRIVKSMVATESTQGDTRITKNAFLTLLHACQGILVELMTNTEILRQMEPNGHQSIQPRQLQAARTMLGVHCLTNSQLPVQIRLGRGLAPPSKDGGSQALAPASE